MLSGLATSDFIAKERTVWLKDEASVSFHDLLFTLPSKLHNTPNVYTMARRVGSQRII